jgi:hypothetical protein
MDQMEIMIILICLRMYYIRRSLQKDLYERRSSCGLYVHYSIQVVSEHGFQVMLYTCTSHSDMLLHLIFL